MALTANMPNRKRNSRNFPFGNTLNVNCCTKWGQRQNFANSQYYICYLKIDLIDSWAEIEILIVAHNLPIEKYTFDQNKCQFGNFPNVPTTGWYGTENMMN